MKKITFLTLLMMLFVAVSVTAKTKGIKEFHAYFTQHLDPDPRNDGKWKIGEVEELKEPFVIQYSKNYVRVDNISYFIDKSTVQNQDYTPEENPGYGKSIAFVAKSLIGEEIFVTIEYANRENPNLWGFTIFDRANQGRFYLGELQQ